MQPMADNIPLFFVAHPIPIVDNTDTAGVANILSALIPLEQYLRTTGMKALRLEIGASQQDAVKRSGSMGVMVMCRFAYYDCRKYQYSGILLDAGRWLDGTTVPSIMVLGLVEWLFMTGRFDPGGGQSIILSFYSGIASKTIAYDPVPFWSDVRLFITLTRHQNQKARREEVLLCYWFTVRVWFSPKSLWINNAYLERFGVNAHIASLCNICLNKGEDLRTASGENIEPGLSVLSTGGSWTVINGLSSSLVNRWEPNFVAGDETRNKDNNYYWVYREPPSEPENPTSAVFPSLYTTVPTSLIPLTYNGFRLLHFRHRDRRG
ncbi:hypothetical protein BDV93DRAFT_516148 [Ceratobasidium sp. AG-I]|nr:hypothetical protein BDV93DRAFT_516148 [Ceratobasidium sp. AG-I]